MNQLLLHMCCGPCSAFPVKRLRDMGYAPDGYFFNPNIHPYKEFRHRLETTREFADNVEMEITVDEAYPLKEFLRDALAADAKGKRCQRCYDLRLRQAAEFAKANGYAVFTTSLLVSPYQQHELIKDTAEKAARAVGIAFLYEDFRTGWQEGVEISRAQELYRQPYCGCIFSEQERYDKSMRKKKK